MQIVCTRKKQLFLCFIAALLFLVGISLASNIPKLISCFSNVKKVVVIDAGHGSIDPGAHYNGIKEKTINLEVAFQLKKLLEESNIKVVMTREDDSLYNNSRREDIIYRARKANEVKADVFISIHVNKFPSPKPYGGQVYYYEGKEAKLLSEKIQEQLKKIQPDNYRSIDKGNYYVLKKTKCPAVLVEIGFISNPIDRKRITNPTEQKKIAIAIRDGLTTFFHEQFTSKNQLDDNVLMNHKTLQQECVLNDGLNLYFAEITQQSIDLIPIHIPLPREKILTVTGTDHLSFLERTAVETITKLIEGPEDKNLISIIPKETKLLSIRVQNGLATLNFDQNLNKQHWGGAEAEKLTVESIVKTLTNLPGIDQVQILIEGHKGETIAGHIIFDKPLTKEMFQ
ncbi:MAG: N-acetylmuramoyl-L-alanine amidase [Halanaerobiales bacterium]|nr:N-acetylmuramoyl-L-alanine amidase [Halanaerobiales bacterium]